MDFTLSIIVMELDNLAGSYAMAEDPASREAPYPGYGQQQCAYAKIQQTERPCNW